MPPGGYHSVAIVRGASNHSWSGILRPINADGTSVFKAGATIAVKFMLTGDSAGISDLAATLTFAQISAGVVPRGCAELFWKPVNNQPMAPSG